MPPGGLPRTGSVCIIPRSLITGPLRHGFKKALDRQSVSSYFREEGQVCLEKAGFCRFGPPVQISRTYASQGTFKVGDREGIHQAQGKRGKDNQREKTGDAGFQDPCHS